MNLKRRLLYELFDEVQYELINELLGKLYDGFFSIKWPILIYGYLCEIPIFFSIQDALVMLICVREPLYSCS